MTKPTLQSKADLLKLRESLRAEQAKVQTRVLVGVSSCGIAAGSREVLEKFQEILKTRGMTTVVAEQSGCIGYCYIEPTVEIIKQNGQRLLLGNVKLDDVQNVIDLHILNDIRDSKYVVPSVFKGCL